jgi:hypothetical protein
MNEKIMKLIMEKKKNKASQMTKPEASAKESVLGDLKGMMDKMGSEKVKGLKKVTVASTDEAGLKKGLAKAEDMIDKKKSISDMMKEAEAGDDSEEKDETENEKLLELLDPNAEASEPEHEGMESDEMMAECKTPEEVDAKIAKLLKLKEELNKKA